MILILYSIFIMKRTAFFCLCIYLTFILSNCASEPANVQNNNINATVAPSPVQTQTPPTAAKSPAIDKKAAEANYPQIVQEIHQRINEFRQSQGLQPLTLNPVISEQARQHSVEMSQTPDTISHSDFNERINELRQQLPYQAAAENVAANLNYENPGVQAVEGWKNSPTHRKNILGDYTQTGIGVAQSENGSYFFTQIFWKP